jgi:hypothetical protein
MSKLHPDGLVSLLRNPQTNGTSLNLQLEIKKNIKQMILKAQQLGLRRTKVKFKDLPAPPKLQIPKPRLNLAGNWIEAREVE